MNGLSLSNAAHAAITSKAKNCVKQYVIIARKTGIKIMTIKKPRARITLKGYIVYDGYVSAYSTKLNKAYALYKTAIGTKKGNIK